MNRENPDLSIMRIQLLGSPEDPEIGGSRELRLEEWSERAIREIQERDRRIKQLESGIIQRDRRIENLLGQIDERDRKISELFDRSLEIPRLQYQLIQIRTSTAWKIAGILDRYLPISLIKRLFWTITGKRSAKLAEEKIYTELRDSGLFDAEYYLRVYPDVASAGADPLKHYIDNYRQGRNPNPNFDTLAYLRDHPEIDINPLLHYSRAARSGDKP